MRHWEVTYIFPLKVKNGGGVMVWGSMAYPGVDIIKFIEDIIY